MRRASITEYTMGSLFAGIGGFELGFERARVASGSTIKCVWQVEDNRFCQSVLQKHWPDVPRMGDVREFPPPGDWSVDIITAGFPCTDISNAGRMDGIHGEHSGLYREAVRVVRLLRPRVFVVENVAALLVRGMDTLLGELAEIGANVEWHVVPAAHLGAAHIRDRVYLFAYVDGEGLPFPREKEIFGARRREKGGESRREARWPDQPGVRRTSHGVPRRVDRIRARGNAVCPPVSEWIAELLIRTLDENSACEAGR